jgi:hypothetical protein
MRDVTPLMRFQIPGTCHCTLENRLLPDSRVVGSVGPQFERLPEGAMVINFRVRDRLDAFVLPASRQFGRLVGLKGIDLVLRVVLSSEALKQVMDWRIVGRIPNEYNNIVANDFPEKLGCPAL